MSLFVQDTWLSRLNEAQTAFTQACKRANSFVPGGFAAAARAADASKDPQSTAVLTAQKNARRRLQQRGDGRLEASSSSAVDAQPAAGANDGGARSSSLRRTNSRAVRSSSSDAAASTDAEPPPRPVSPRRISDPICQHSDTQAHDRSSVPSPEVPLFCLSPGPITTAAQVHSPLTAVAGFETVSLSPAASGSCFTGGEFFSAEADAAASGRHCWRLSSSTPTARRNQTFDPQQQQQQQRTCSAACPSSSPRQPRGGDL